MYPLVPADTFNFGVESQNLKCRKFDRKKRKRAINIQAKRNKCSKGKLRSYFTVIPFKILCCIYFTSSKIELKGFKLIKL